MGDRTTAHHRVGHARLARRREAKARAGSVHDEPLRADVRLLLAAHHDALVALDGEPVVVPDRLEQVPLGVDADLLPPRGSSKESSL